MPRYALCHGTSCTAAQLSAAAACAARAATARAAREAAGRREGASALRGVEPVKALKCGYLVWYLYNHKKLGEPVIIYWIAIPIIMW